MLDTLNRQDPFNPWGDDLDDEYEEIFEGSLRERVDAAIAARHPTNNQLRLTKLIEGMTPSQFEAATYDGTPLVILAGAGTGKTKTLTSRIALLVTAGMAQPSEILALTFTNKAAKEMATRIAAMLEVDAIAVMATTFHAFCAKMLREYGGEVGWKTDWTILDSDDTRKMMRLCWKDRYGIPPEKEILDAVEEAHDTLYCSGGDSDSKRALIENSIARAADDYQNRKAIDNVKDFSDLITEMNILLDESDYVREEIQRRFRYVLVDEYQDTDSRQEMMLTKIMGKNPNLTVVGDEDQLVYTWRHAQIDNILRFKERWNGHRVMLEQNFRSTQNILTAANRLIGHNQDRLGKELYTYDEPGDVIMYGSFDSAPLEAECIVEQIAQDIADGCPHEEIAVLVRASHALNFIESALNQKGIRYTLSGGKKFQDRAEIKDISAYLRLIANAHDRMAFERAVCAPKRGVGPGMIEEIDLSAKKMRTDVTDAARRLALGKILNENVREPVMQFCKVVSDLAADAIHGADAEIIVRKIVEDTGYGQSIKDDLAEAHNTGDKEAIEALSTRLTNIGDLINIAKGKNLTEFLDHMGLSEETRRDQGKGIWIGTIHAAKGLEFFNVYLPAWEQGVLPSNQAVRGESDLEEERRLGYVALTRARKKLLISSAAVRFSKETSPSLFLADLGYIERPHYDSEIYETAGNPPETDDCPF